MRKAQIGNCTLYQADCRDVFGMLEMVDSIVTDPPYGLSFMQRAWDYDVPDATLWSKSFSIIKPGGHLVSFFSPRTYHRGAIQIEDAGFEIRDQIMWIFGSGFPKSLDVSKAFDKAAGVEREVTGRRTDRAASPRRDMRGGKYIGASRNIDLSAITAPATESAKQWEGWGTALKPAHEPLILARRPLIGTVAENVSSFGTGALNIDAARVPIDEELPKYTPGKSGLGKHGIYGSSSRDQGANSPTRYGDKGRWPANIVHDGSDEVLAAFPDAPGQQAALTGDEPTVNGFSGAVAFGGMKKRMAFPSPRIDLTKSSGRFFYCAKANKADRNEGLESLPLRQYSHDGRRKPIENAYQRNDSIAHNFHPTVKPTRLMQWLIKLVTPEGGTILDPFMGSGSTGKAATLLGFKFIGIEREPEYFEIACRRIEAAARLGDCLF